MTAEAKIDMSAADRNVLQLIQSISGGFDKIVASQERMEKASVKSTKAAEDGFEKMVTSAGRTVTSILGIGSALAVAQKGWGLLNQSLDEYIAKNERARQTTINLAGRQLQAANAFSGDKTVGSFVEFDSRLQQMSRELNIPMSGLYNQAEKALGGGGILTNEQKLAAVKTVASYSPNAPDEEKGWLQAFTMDMMTAKNIDSQTALGMVLMGNQKHRTTDQGQYSKYVAGGIKSLVNMGTTLEEAFAVTTAASQTSSDFMGRESTTGSTTGYQAILEATARFKQTSGMGLDQRLNWLHTDKTGQSVRNRLVGALSDEAVKQGYNGKPGFSVAADSMMFWVNMLEGRGEGWNQYQAARKDGVTVEGAAQFAAKKSAEIAALPLQRSARANLMSDAGVEGFQLQPGRSYEGTAQDAFTKFVDDSGLDWFDRTELKAKFRYFKGSQDPFDYAENYMREMAAEKKKAATRWYTPQSAVEGLQKDSDILLRIADTLDRIQQQAKPTPPAANGDRPTSPIGMISNSSDRVPGLRSR